MSLSPKRAHVAVSILGVKGHNSIMTQLCSLLFATSESQEVQIHQPQLGDVPSNGQNGQDS